jgi:hypothetical protein
MSLADELKKLQDLHSSGGLTDDEYAKAKEAVLGGAPVPEAPRSETHMPPAERTLGEAANRYVSFQIVAGVVGLIIFLVFFLGFWLPGFLEVRRKHQEFDNQWQQIDKDIDAFKRKNGF